MLVENKFLSEINNLLIKLSQQLTASDSMYALLLFTNCTIYLGLI